LILDGRLETRRAMGGGGYLSILVDPDQAARALKGADTGGVPLHQASRRIGISDAALGALIAHGHVATLIGRNPVNKCPQRLVPADEIACFQGRYISLWRLSKECNVQIAAMKTMLDSAGVAPAFEGVFAKLYRTADLAGKAIGDRRRAPSPTDKRPGNRPKLSRRRKGG
jgi:hypothetical protein